MREQIEDDLRKQIKSGRRSRGKSEEAEQEYLRIQKQAELTK